MTDPKAVHTKLLSVRLATASQTFGFSEALRIGHNCSSIVPARMDPDGSAVPTDKGQASQGILVRAQTRAGIAQGFFPYGQVIEFIYGPEDAKK